MPFSTVQASTRKVQGTPADQAKTTLGQIEESAASAADEAYPLQQIGTGLSPDSHQVYLMELKDDINRMGREISSLNAESGSLAPWEKQAIDKVEPLLRETAGNVQKAIEDFNQNRNDLWRADYRNSLADARQESAQIAKSLKDYLKYAKAHDQEQQLSGSLTGGGQ